jgi:hypothetical protein
MNDRHLDFHVHPQSDGINLTFADIGTFVSRTVACTPGPTCVHFKSVEDLQTKLKEVGLPEQIAHGEIGPYPVTENQLRDLGFPKVQP